MDYSISFKLLFNSLGIYCKVEYWIPFPDSEKRNPCYSPGFINYKYRDGELPGHTKPYFNEYKILGVHGVIVTNALLFIYKIRYIPSLLPISVRLVIADDAPIPGSTYETSNAWLTIYGDTVYRKSVFFKGPLLSINPNFIDTILTKTQKLGRIDRG